MRISAFLSLCFLFFSFTTDPVKFPSEVLNDPLLDTDDKSVTLSDVLDRHKGKTVLIDMWASWCGDCIKGIPDLQKLQAKTKDDNLVYLFLSFDNTPEIWKKEMVKLGVRGEHYFVKSGGRGPLAKGIDLDWIPRYIVVGADGDIKLFKAIKAADKAILEAIKADQ